jgi:hypothetical protein
VFGFFPFTLFKFGSLLSVIFMISFELLIVCFFLSFIFIYRVCVLLLYSLSPFDHKKQSPPPKSAPYKPVPPPKPKNYRPPANASSSTASNNQQPMTPNSNYWNHSPPGTLNHPNRPAGGGGGGGGGGSSSGGDVPPSSGGANNHHGYYSHGPPSSNTASAIHNGINSYRYEDDTNGGFDSGIELFKLSSHCSSSIHPSSFFLLF